MEIQNKELEERIIELDDKNHVLEQENKELETMSTSME